MLFSISCLSCRLRSCLSCSLFDTVGKYVYPVILFALTSWASPSTPVTVTLEYAFDQETKNWGLMQRSSLPTDYGMLFDFGSDTQISLWSFNCLIDLGVAFLDDRGVIQEIAILKAYPQMMDPKRPITSPKELYKYPNNDPIRRFFAEHAITSKKPSRYALETLPTFFQQNNLAVGDQLQWNRSTHKGIFLRDSH